MGSASWRRLAAFATALGLAGPPAARAGDAPTLTPEEELTLADELLFCTRLMTALAQVPGPADRQRGLEKQRDLFFVLAVTLMAPERLKARVDEGPGEVNAWLEKAAGDPALLRAGMADCARKREAHSGWILERRKAASAARRGGAGFTWGGTRWVHRWSRDGQHEFTPLDQPDLDRWTRMVTVDVHPQVTDGEGLAGVVAAVTARYRAAGRVVRSARTPGAGGAPAEHFVSAVLEDAGVAEAVLARFFVRDGTGFVVVSARRAYGEDAEQDAQAWLEAYGADEEAALMSFGGFPSLDALRALPRSP